MLGGRSMGRLLQRLAQPDSDLCREQGGASLPVDRKARAGGSDERDCQPIQEAAEHLHCASSGSMLAVPGWRHLPAGKGGGSKARSGWEDGEAAEGGPSGSVDGQPQRARMGKAGEMSHGDLVHLDLSRLDLDL